MPKKAAELGPLQVSRLKEAGLHPVGGVAGLRLQVSASGARSWILRVSVGGKTREKGLGGYPDVTLAGARDAARSARAKIADGVDPIEEARAARSTLRAAVASAWTFDECSKAYIEAKSDEWTNAKHAAQWTNTLATYASPKLGNLLVRDIDLPHILAVLEPIWRVKTETASRVRMRLEAVLDWAMVKKYRDGPNPARWKGHLDKQLAKPSKVAKVVHHAALPIDSIGEFMLNLRKQDGIGARALEFTALTAARSGEVRGATWEEIDLDAKVWTVPAGRMKAGKEHRVPLSDAAIRLLRAQPRIKDVKYVFAAARGGQLSDMTLSAVMRRMHAPAVPHGFRSSFNDWATERTSYPNHVIKMALAHTIGDDVEAAYRRGDLFEKRVLLMNDWAKFCEQTKTSGAVIPIKRPRAVRKTA